MPILGKGSQVLALKKDIALSSPILYIACPSRDGNLDDFFKYENQPWPPALSQMNQLRGGQGRLSQVLG